ncbi:Cellulose-binding protein [Pleurostoma richardsiae]|uniref:Cellulose-binding protein n=1 Tax=Pleurostoma richardsiae TaxID=41990 RepID=A0AA38VXD2_9PEZI|nr:Cellulose-binding protein [Pleurostoma richardsiae]
MAPLAFFPRLILLALCLGAQASSTQSQCRPASVHKPRVFVLSDIANEPDDAQSFVRLMVYANELRLHGLVATTSVWLNDTTRPDQIHDIVNAYEASLPNLKQHATGWPSADYLRSLVASGLPVYGMDGVGEGKDSSGSEMLVDAVDASDEPLWVLVWGGASVLAQALWHANATRAPAEAEAFASKVRVYAISDQDNTGAWIRSHWPGMLYIASVHHFNRYALAAWSGISGDAYYNSPGGSKATVGLEWIRENIQSAGELGSKYPDPEFIAEGDTPSLLYVIPTGLSDPEHPEWGSWGGRYGPVNYGEGHFADTVDVMVDDSGRTVMNSQATIWRWRDAFQNDFAARMQWGVKPAFSDANHAPVVVVNGDASRGIVKVITEAGKDVIIDTRESCDSDGDELSFKWWQYFEPSSNNNNPKRDVSALVLDSTSSSKITVSIPPNEVLRKSGRNAHIEDDKHLHLILEVSDGSLISYRRILFTIPGQGHHDSSQEGSSHDEL